MFVSMSFAHKLYVRPQHIFLELVVNTLLGVAEGMEKVY